MTPIHSSVKRHITLEHMGSSASADPLEMIISDDWFDYPGFFRKPAHCQIEVFKRASGEGYTVVIATELAANDGASITNASESLAQRLCETLNIDPSELILVEHYFADKILPEHYSLVKFTRTRSRERNKMWNDFGDRTWLPMEKSELERLLGQSL